MDNAFIGGEVIAGFSTAISGLIVAMDCRGSTLETSNISAVLP
jgi:hypothetical protein